MKKIIVRVTWSKSKYLPMAIQGHKSAAAIKADKRFLNPKVATTDLDVAATRMETAVANKDNGAAGKDELRLASEGLNTLLHGEADYVSDFANGDETIIHSAGFESTSDKMIKAESLMPTVGGPSIETMKGGSVNIVNQTVAGTKQYIFVLVEGKVFNVTIQDNGQIVIPVGTIAHVFSCSKHTCTFTHLAGKMDIMVAVVLHNASGYTGFGTATAGETMS